MKPIEVSRKPSPKTELALRCPQGFELVLRKPLRWKCRKGSDIVELEFPIGFKFYSLPVYDRLPMPAGSQTTFRFRGEDYTEVEFRGICEMIDYGLDYVAMVHAVIAYNHAELANML